MNGPDFLLALLIAASAVAFGLFAGRAQAERMRDLKNDVSNGTLRGALVIAFVIVVSSIS